MLNRLLANTKKTNQKVSCILCKNWENKNIDCKPKDFNCFYEEYEKKEIKYDLKCTKCIFCGVGNIICFYCNFKFTHKLDIDIKGKNPCYECNQYPCSKNESFNCNKQGDYLGYIVDKFSSKDRNYMWLILNNPPIHKWRDTLCFYIKDINREKYYHPRVLVRDSHLIFCSIKQSPFLS